MSLRRPDQPVPTAVPQVPSAGALAAPDGRRGTRHQEEGPRPADKAACRDGIGTGDPMTRRTAEIVSPRPRSRKLFARRPASLELHGVSFRPADHYTRAWPGPVDSPDAPFRLVVLPIRLLALAVLWATSSPIRILVAGLLTAAVLAL